MPRGRHGGRRHGGHHRHRAHHHHHHGIHHHHHHGFGHRHRHRHHGIGHHHHHHHVGWHFRPGFGRRHRHVGSWPLQFVLFRRRRPTNVAPMITTVTTTTGETVNVAQPVTATVAQGTGVPTVTVDQSTIPTAQQPGYFFQQPGSYPPPQPGQQPPYPYPQPGQQPPYPPVQPRQQPPYPPTQPGYPPQTDPSQADPYPPVPSVATNPYSQPVAYDASGQPVQPNPPQTQDEEFDECTCYCTIL